MSESKRNSTRKHKADASDEEEAKPQKKTKKKKTKAQSEHTASVFRDWQAFLIERRTKFIEDGRKASDESLTQWRAGMLVQNQRGELFRVEKVVNEKKVRVEVIPSLEELHAETGIIVKPKFKVVQRVSMPFLYSEKTGHLQRSYSNSAVVSGVSVSKLLADPDTADAGEKDGEGEP